MRKASATFVKSPDFENPKDEILLRHGKPDMRLIVEGQKLYVHTHLMSVYSDTLRHKIIRPDPMLGHQETFGSTDKHPRRRKEAVIALLSAIYPPQKIPPLSVSEEVYDIAKEYQMGMLLEKLKLGIIKNCDMGPLELQDPPDIAFDAFAEFALDELRDLPGWLDLPAATKVEVCRRRVTLLEAHLNEMKDVRHGQDRIFRKCPPELAIDAEEPPDHDLENEVDKLQRSYRTMSRPQSASGLASTGHAPGRNSPSRPLTASSPSLSNRWR
mmetsp:Transcript_5682/g.9209  ORF Transcript_5682/g.9209 Transcript_5682/m.9209 type:complete len:270 (+) Transcript_5682:137-946(+)